MNAILFLYSKYFNKKYIENINNFFTMLNSVFSIRGFAHCDLYEN